MQRLFNGGLKFLFLAPILLLIGFAIVFQKGIVQIGQQILLEKMTEKRMQIDLIATLIDNYVKKDNDWGEYDYPSDINVLIERLDIIDYAGQFNEQLQIISKHETAPGYKPFNPMQDPKFAEAVKNSESGEYTLPYENGHKVCEMNLYFRKVPGDIKLENRSVLVIGFTEDSIANPNMWLTLGMVVLIVITFLVNTVFVVLLCHLGNIYKARIGPKWRAML